MSLITDTWCQLVQRRLWPVALLLVAALGAVPVLLAKDPAPAAPTVAAGGEVAADDAVAKPVVALATAGDGSTRHVLGARKDPFRPDVLPKRSPAPSSSTTRTVSADGAASAGASSADSSAPKSLAGAGSDSSPASTGGDGASLGAPSAASPPPGASTPAPVATPPATKPAPDPSSPPYSIEVRFGDATSDALETTRIKRLAPLPDAENPVAIYLGPGADKRSAVFLVDASVTPEGDGTCTPYAADCQSVVLRPGETEFFDVKDPETGEVTQTDELDLLSIARPKAATASRTRVSRATFRVRLPRVVSHRDRPRQLGAQAASARTAHVVAVLEPGM